MLPVISQSNINLLFYFDMVALFCTTTVLHLSIPSDVLGGKILCSFFFFFNLLPPFFLFVKKDYCSYVIGTFAILAAQILLHSLSVLPGCQNQSQNSISLKSKIIPSIYQEHEKVFLYGFLKKYLSEDTIVFFLLLPLTKKGGSGGWG